MDIILGYQHGRIYRTDTNGNIITFDFALTNLNGRQIESVEPIGVETTTVNLEINPELAEENIYQVIKGYRVAWTFTYADFASGADLVNFGQLLNGLVVGDVLRLIPRLDFPTRIFNVVIVMNTLNVGVSTGGANAQFNKDFIVQFKTKSLVKDLNWQLVPDPSTVFGVVTQDFKTFVERQ